MARTRAAAAAPSTTDSAAKGKKALRGRIAQDLLQELLRPGPQGAQWSRESRGQRLVQTIITSDSANREMTQLRADIHRVGGNVHLKTTASAVETMTGALNATVRTDMQSAVEAGTLVPGSSSLLASGKTLPTVRSSTVAGTTFN